MKPDEDYMKIRSSLIGKIRRDEEIRHETIIKYNLDRFIEEYEDRTDRLIRERSAVDFT